MPRAPASSAAAQPPEATARPARFRPWRPSFGSASQLVSIISQMLRPDDPRQLAQDAGIKSLALLQARKATLLHRKEELIAQIAGERVRHRATSSLIAELQAVTTEILSIG